MRERAADVRDVAARICRMLNGEAEHSIPEPCLIAAEELTPSQTVQFPRGFVRGMLTARGAANSHTGILARTLGVPAVSQLPVSAELHGHTAILDGFAGTLTLDPNEQMLAEATAKIAAQQAQREALRQLVSAPSVTQDGHSIRLYANIAGTDDLPLLQESGAEGVGLLRSEFLYLGRSTYPTEDELFESYKTIVQAMDGREIIIRTLDIGADKQCDYFELKKEENPSMGCRAIRICLTQPDIFKTQLRAILRASAYGNMSVMFPMITDVEEVKQAKLILEKIKNELKDEKIPFNEEIKIGVMIETPAAVMISGELAREADFFSIGTNDLTQLTLGMDRTNSRLERFYNTHHPALLKMIRIIANNIHLEGKKIALCGDLAADLSLTEKFIQMGIDELSVAPSQVLALRKKIREIQ